jgi:ABC-type nitrate/sulfonate/bicarbonate transport system substrate-binding protein
MKTRLNGKWRRCAGFSAAVGCIVILAGCSSSASSGSANSSSSSGAASSTTVPSIKIAVAGGFVDFSDIFLAQAEGLFAKHGVNVTLQQDTGSNTLNYVVSQQVDMAIYTAPIALQAAEEGKPTTIFYAVERDPGAAFLTGSSIKTVAQMKSVSNCRIAVATTGSQGYAYGSIYKKALGLNNCSLIQTSLPALELGGLKSGSYNAAVTTYQVGLQGVSQGDHMLVNPLDTAERAQYPVPPYPTAVLFGLQSNLTAKKAAIVRVLAAVNDAVNLEKTMTNQQWAQALQQVSGDFKAVSLPALESEVQTIRPFIGDGTVGTMTDKAGYISSALWSTALEQYQNWGLQGFDPSAASVSYSTRIDMSYLSQADSGQ